MLTLCTDSSRLDPGEVNGGGRDYRIISSINIITRLTHIIIIGTSPVQLIPSPLYPWLQVQMELPGALVHSALASQLLHSSRII